MDTVKNISIIFTSIFFESLPFILLGSIISSIIETYVQNETIAKLIPKNKVLASFVGIFLGFFIPACDCAVIPVSKRLLKKKVPIHVAVSFMLASPIINPVVLLSTYYAFFNKNPDIFWLRIILGIAIAFTVGIIIGILFKDKDVLKDGVIDDNHNHDHDHHHHHSCSCHNCQIKSHEHNLKNDFLSIVKHTSIDFFEVVKFLMIGALITSMIQSLLPRNILLVFNDNKILSVITLMIFAYLISLCSTSDSFIGKSLLSSFPKSSVVSYLLLGPMIDIKNTFVLLGNYNKKFVITLISLIFVVIFIYSIFVVMLI